MVNPIIIEFTVEKEMGYSRTEFFNQFKLFAKDLSYTINNNCILLSGLYTNKHKSSELKISLYEQSNRTIGALSISRLLVNFKFTHFTHTQYQLFLKKFDLSFQRGGG